MRGILGSSRADQGFGFFSVEFPEDHVSALKSDDHIHVELDAEVKHQ